MEKLDQENKEMRSKFQSYDRELKEMSSVTEKLTDENEYWSRKVEFLNEKVMKTEVSNKHLSSLVDNLAKKNGELTDTIALQAKDIAACNNKLDKIFAEQSSSSVTD